MKVFFVLRLYDLLNKGRVCDDVWMSLRRCKGINIVHGVLICHFTEITSDNCAFVMLRRSPLSNKGSSFSKAQIAWEKYFSWIFSSSEQLKAVVSDITRQHPSTFILPWAEIEKKFLRKEWRTFSAGGMRFVCWRRSKSHLGSWIAHPKHKLHSSLVVYVDGIALDTEIVEINWWHTAKHKTNRDQGMLAARQVSGDNLKALKPRHDKCLCVCMATHYGFLWWTRQISSFFSVNDKIKTCSARRSYGYSHHWHRWQQHAAIKKGCFLSRASLPSLHKACNMQMC